MKPSPSTSAAAPPLFYQTIVPLNRQKHGRVRLATPERPYGFAASSQFIPALTDEFAAGCRELPIVFLAGPVRPTPVFMVGLAPRQNLVVDAEGRWDGAYVPAFLRRYPFIRGEVPGQEPVVCIDETFAGLNQEQGNEFFRDGAQTPFLDERIAYVNAYYEAAQRTDALCELIRDLGLLKSVSIEVKAAGSSIAVHGLFTIDEEKLAALSTISFERLRQAGALTPVHAHLISLASIDRLAARQPRPAQGLDS